MEAIDVRFMNILTLYPQSFLYLSDSMWCDLISPQTRAYMYTVALVVQELPDVYVEKMLPFLAERLDNSAHLQFYLRWCTLLLTYHGTKLKQKASSLMASLRDLQKSILQKQADLGKMYVHA